MIGLIIIVIFFLVCFVIQKRTDYKLIIPFWATKLNKRKIVFSKGGSDIKIGDTRSK